MNIDDSRPIWLQLVDEFRRRIASGVWKPETKLPSVRDLALDLGVNPNTVQRALAEIDRTGLTVTERTAGRFVTADADAIRKARRDLALGSTDEYVQAVAGLGMDLDETITLVASRWTSREDAP